MGAERGKTAHGLMNLWRVLCVLKDNRTAVSSSTMNCLVYSIVF